MKRFSLVHLRAVTSCKWPDSMPLGSHCEVYRQAREGEASTRTLTMATVHGIISSGGSLARQPIMVYNFIISLEFNLAREAILASDG